MPDGPNRFGSTDGKSRRVLHALRTDIVAGALPPGERLTESSLCRRYRVSRVPVREALRTLAVQGFVEIRPNQGASVAVPGDDDADDLYTVQAAIEELTAARCARRVAGGNDTTVRMLWRVVAEAEAELAARRAGRLPELAAPFHLTMAECSGSGALTALLRQVADRIEWLHAAGPVAGGRRCWDEHRGIAEAIGAGDAAGAAKRVREHVGRARERSHRAR